MLEKTPNIGEDGSEQQQGLKPMLVSLITSVLMLFCEAQTKADSCVTNNNLNKFKA